MPEWIKFPVVLVAVSLISAATLAYVFQATEGRIEAQKKLKESDAERIVFPGAGDAVEREAAIAGSSGGAPSVVRYKEVRKDGAVAGYIVKGAAEGYSSTIQVLVGVERDFAVRGLKILEQKETPGLGTRVEEVASDKTWFAIIAGKRSLGAEPGVEDPLPWFTKQFGGLGPEDVRLKIDGGKVDAITGATISSRAVAKAVEGAVDGLRGAVGGTK